MAYTRLTNKQLLTSAIWNATMTEIEARQAAVGSANLVSPLTGVDIDMDQQYEIVGLRSLWNIINAGEYDDLEDAVAAADTAGGTCVLIPPDTNVNCTNATINTSGIIILGAGPTSVIKMLASDGPIITTATGGLSGIGIYNLTIDMSGGNAGAQGVVMKRVARFGMGDVYFTGGKGVHLKLTNGGTAGQSCTNARLSNLHFSGGTGTGAHHIFADDLDGLIATGIYSSSCPSTSAAIYMAQAASAKLRDITMVNIQVDSPTTKGVSIVSNSGTASDDCSRVTLSTVHVDTPLGTGIELGATSARVKYGRLVNCHVVSAGGITGIALNSTYGMVLGCSAPGHAPGLDLVDSTDVFVNGCLYKDCTTYGIDADGTTDCTILGNDVGGATTAGIKKSSSTGLECQDNIGDVMGSVQVHRVNTTINTGTSEQTAYTYSIPANTITREGQALRIRVKHRVGDGDTVEHSVYLGTNKIASFTYTPSGGAKDGITEVLVSLNDQGQSGASNTEVQVDCFNDNATVNAEIGYSQFTVDWTAAVSLYLKIDPTSEGDSGTVHTMTIEYLNGVSV